MTGMWKDYSAGYVKNNRASGLSIVVAAFIAALFLSFLCSTFFNMWKYEIEQIIIEEGDWQGRITGLTEAEDILVIQNFANVERVAVNEELSGAQGKVVDIYFYNKRTIFKDMSLIVNHLGLGEGAAVYHIPLLSLYFIHDPMDLQPPLLMAFFLAVLIILSFSLIMMIRSAFGVSMSGRIHQLGILSSIGATPAQLKTCLMQEAAALCLLPILSGSLLGIAGSYFVIRIMDTMGAAVAGRHAVIFQYSLWVFVITMVLSVFTVLFSAWLPAKKLSKMTPISAIRGAEELRLKKKTNSRLLYFLFGMEGELAGNAVKAQKKALRTAALSLTLSILGFTMMQCFFTLSDISTRYTYFEKYQDVWDVMVTVKNDEPEALWLTQELRELEGVEDCIVYQKASALTTVSKEWQSEAVAALGGLNAVRGVSESGEEGQNVKAPIVILDDEAFIAYCAQLGIAPRLDGTVVLNRIWDSVNSNFRYKSYIPYVKENRGTIELHNGEGEESREEIPVIHYTQEVPVLREEYENYGLVQFMPLSLWRKFEGQIGAPMEGVGADTYIRILADDRTTLSGLNELENNVLELIGQEYETESENRIRDKAVNDEMIRGYRLLIGAFCFLLALIGIANVFSNTLGFLRQRKREFAQYLSVGLTPAGMVKLFCMEALVIAGRPFLIALPLTAAFVAFTVSASHLDVMEFLAEAPILTMAVFSLAILGFIALAYYIGGKKILRCNLAEALRDERG